MIGTLLLLISIVALFFSPWALIFAGPLLLWKVNRWLYLYGRPWRRVHFKMMRDYTKVSATELLDAERQGREFDVTKALLALLEKTNINFPISNKEVIAREFERCETFYDSKLIENYLQKAKGVPPNTSEKLLESIGKMLASKENQVVVRLVVAAVIEQKYSQMDRGEYVLQMALGKAI